MPESGLRGRRPFSGNAKPTLRNTKPWLWMLAAIVVWLALPIPASAADVKLAWDANTEPDLAGYKVYYGQSSRTYGVPTDVGNATSTTVSGLAPGTYYFAVTAYDAAGLESGYSNEVSTTIPLQATGTPAIAITSPTSAGVYTTNATPLTLGGTASDTVPITQIAWVNSAGGGGTAAGTTSWTAAIALQNGTNVITITATDQPGNSASASITVTYSPALKGDLNGDGRVDVLDLQILTDAILGVSPSGNADLNGDGKVDVLDLQILADIIMGVPTKP